MPTPLAQDASPALDSLIRAITTLFVLSLAVERLASIFKGRNWQPMRRGRRGMERGFRVDLTAGAAEMVGKGQAHPVLDHVHCQSLLRAVNTENTVVLGVLLAVLTGANAFQGLPGFTLLEPYIPHNPVSLYLLHLPEVVLTGAAAAIGSSFWYDLLGLLIEARRTRRTLGVAQAEARDPNMDLSALAERTHGFQSRRAEAARVLEGWKAEKLVVRGRVDDRFDPPYVEIWVELASGKTVADTVEITVDGQRLAIPVVKRRAA